MKTVAELRRELPQMGRLLWIGMASASRAPIVAVESAELRVGSGLVGDHHCHLGATREVPPKRQVTLIQHEHLAVIAELLGRESVPPELLRRNLVVAGINLQALKDLRFHVGGVTLEGTGDCHPCSRMSETLGEGGYAAVRGHGGITARVVVPGIIKLGDTVSLAVADASERV